MALLFGVLLCLCLGLWPGGLAFGNEAGDGSESGAGQTEGSASDSATAATVEGDSSENRVNTSQLPDSSFIYDVSLEELAHADSYMDGQTVQVTGEVVGDRIIAEDDSNYCWVVLQSTSKTDAELSVYMPIVSSRMIDTYGAYNKRGTCLQVRGTFHLACDDHQGASGLHADNVSLVETGKVYEQDFEPLKMLPGFLLLILGGVSIGVFNILREKQR